MAAVLDRELSLRLGRDAIFRSHRSIPTASQYPREIYTALHHASVLIAVIGPDWLEAKDATGEPALENERDWVRREIVEALATGTTVLPVYVGGASRLIPAQLPSDLMSLAFLQGADLSPRRFDADLEALLDAVATITRSSTSGEPLDASTRVGTLRAAISRGARGHRPSVTIALVVVLVIVGIIGGRWWISGLPAGQASDLGPQAQPEVSTGTAEAGVLPRSQRPQSAETSTPQSTRSTPTTLPSTSTAAPPAANAFEVARDDSGCDYYWYSALDDPRVQYRSCLRTTGQGWRAGLQLRNRGSFPASYSFYWAIYASRADGTLRGLVSPQSGRFTIPPNGVVVQLAKDVQLATAECIGSQGRSLETRERTGLWNSTKFISRSGRQCATPSNWNISSI